MTEILIATGNRGKISEFYPLLNGLAVVLLTPADIGLPFDVPETGQTYAENAALKAEALARQSGRLTLGDDSGLEVEALDGAPGLYSARYAGPGASEAQRRAKLIEALRAHPAPWPARFRCALAVARPGGETRLFEGVCQGEIISEERGQNGFGYDPIFFMAEYGRTMAELPADLKNQVSHRARAVQAAWSYLKELG